MAFDYYGGIEFSAGVEAVTRFIFALIFCSFLIVRQIFTGALGNSGDGFFNYASAFVSEVSKAVIFAFNNVYFLMQFDFKSIFAPGIFEGLFALLNVGFMVMIFFQPVAYFMNWMSFDSNLTILCVTLVLVCALAWLFHNPGAVVSSTSNLTHNISSNGSANMSLLNMTG